jgi:hypothetical protein
VPAGLNPCAQSGWGSYVLPAGVLSDTRLTSVFALTREDIWAVGTAGQHSTATLSLHFDGTHWDVIDMPAVPGYLFYDLYSVAATSADDVWAVGSMGDGTHRRTLTLHFDGTAWTVVSSPNPDPDSNELYGVTALSPGAVWAAGHTTAPGASAQAFILSYDGTAWSSDPLPQAGTASLLYAIAARTPADIWAVGSYADETVSGGTLVLHYDGTAWQVMPSPNPPGIAHLYAVAALAADDVWAVGIYRNASGFWQTLTMHYDGTTWQIVPSPSLAGYYNYLYALAAVAPDEVWAVGRANDAVIWIIDKPLAMRWDGTEWALVETGETRNGYFQGLTVDDAGLLYAVGQYLDMSYREWSLVDLGYPACHQALLPLASR